MQKLIISISLLLCLASCGTIVNGSSQKIPINSIPDDASIKIYNSRNSLIFKGQTPAFVTLNRGEDGFFKGALYRLEIEKPGYKKFTTTLEPILSEWYIFGNIVTCGLGWLIVDPLSGGMWTLVPDDINLELISEFTHNKYDSNQLMIVLKQEIPQETFDKLNLEKIK